MVNVSQLLQNAYARKVGTALAAKIPPVRVNFGINLIVRTVAIVTVLIVSLRCVLVVRRDGWDRVVWTPAPMVPKSPWILGNVSVNLASMEMAAMLSVQAMVTIIL